MFTIGFAMRTPRNCLMAALILGLSGASLSQTVQPTVTLLGAKKRIAATPLEEAAPRIVYNSLAKKYFVSWMEQRHNPTTGGITQTSIKGRHISATGTPERVMRYFLAPDIVFEHVSAYDSLNSRYLLAWDVPSTLGNFHSRVLTATGNVLAGGSFNVPQYPELTTSTYSHTNNEYAVAAPFIRISPDGRQFSTSLPRNGYDFTLIPVPGSSDYFLFYANNSSTFFFQRLNREGVPLTAPRAILSSWIRGERHVVFNPEAHEFLLVYRTPPGFLKAFRLSETGRRINSPVSVASPIVSYWAQAFYHSGMYFVAYAFQDQIYLRGLSKTGQVATGSFALTKPIAGLGQVAEFTLARGMGNTFLLTWIESHNSPTGYDLAMQLFKIVP